jgi:hypothetical protein
LFTPSIPPSKKTHSHISLPQSQANPWRTKSRLIQDPHFPDPRSRSAASRPALKNFIKAPLSQASYRPSPSNLLHTRAVKTHRVRLINLNVWPARRIRKPCLTRPTHPPAHDHAHDFTMKYFQQTVDFDYSWEEVSTSNWQKYGPWNEKTPHVIAVDTLSRSVDPSTGIVSASQPHAEHGRRSALRVVHLVASYMLQIKRLTCLLSYAQSDSSHANNPHRNGSLPSSAASTHPWSTRHPTSTPLLRSSPCAR